MPELLQEYVTVQAERHPDHVAVVGADETLTYGELEAMSNQIAHILRTGGLSKGDRVCLLMPKSPKAIAAIVGIYKADAIYVPLDPGSPSSRLAKIVGACQSRWLLGAGPVAGLLLDELLADEGVGPSISVGWLDQCPASGEKLRAEFTLEAVLGQPTTPREYENAGQDAAHILFTSGSTGTPKGVIITHASVIHFVDWGTKYFGIDRTDRISGHPPLHFDLSVFDIFGAFAAGAELCLVPLELNVLPHKLAEFIRASELTQWFSVPSVLNYMAKFDVVRFGDFPSLRRLLWCGEVFPTPAVVYWMKRLPHVRFTNLYGPTETTIASSYYTVPECPGDEREAIPIGTACGGEELLVLDEARSPVAPGEIGELYIGGVGLSPGYWGDPERTRAVFLPHSGSAQPAARIYKTGDLAQIGEDGLVYFLGRADTQIKSRGYRIELGEIEAALNAVNLLQECAVVAVPTDGFEGNVVCCGYVPLPGRNVTPLILRKALSKVLPSYMLPSSWMALERLPKNGNGKIDRRRLRDDFLQNGNQPEDAQFLSAIASGRNAGGDA